VGVESFGLDHALAVQPESTLAAVLCGFFQNALLRSRWCGEDEKFAVGEDAVDVEEKQLDFFGARVGHVGIEMMLRVFVRLDFNSTRSSYFVYGDAGLFFRTRHRKIVKCTVRKRTKAYGIGQM